MALTNVMNTILDWEKDLDYVEKVHISLGKPFNLDDEDRRLHLINKCPKEIGDYILRESIRFPTYASARSEIVEHIARSKRHIRGGVQALSQEYAANEPEDYLNVLEGFDELDDEEREYIQNLAEFGEDHQKSIMALVLNSKVKSKGKGKGKGKKGLSKGAGGADADKKGPVGGCYNCGEDHFARECPHPPQGRRQRRQRKGQERQGEGRAFHHAESVELVLPLSLASQLGKMVAQWRQRTRRPR